MKTRITTVLLLLVFVGVGESCAQEQPNFVILFIDDMGWRDWSGNGSDYLVTPNIDKLAAEGMVFDQGYVNAANCAPSRCAILSGQYRATGKATQASQRDFFRMKLNQL